VQALIDLMATPLSGAVVAALIGLLLGLEREHSQRSDGGLFAGIRTFPILTLSGFVAARVAGLGAEWVLPTTLLAIGGLAIASYVRGANAHLGATTEVTAILAPLLGAMVAWREGVLAASVAVLVALLLAMKPALHRLAGAITEDEIFAILKFCVLAMILLPLLPNRALGPYDALVPRQVGIVVVVLSAVSLGGYLLVRTLGARAGWTLAGLLGGLGSSTAVTLSLSSKAREHVDEIRALAVGIVLASTVLYVRVLLVVSLFDVALAAYLTPAMLVLLLCGGGFALVAYRKLGPETRAGVTFKNPAEIGKALVLGLVFSTIVVLARAAQANLGTSGIWATGAVGGLVDVDSVAIAVAGMRRGGLVSLGVGSGAVLLATLANLVLKGGVVIVAGGRDLARRVAPAFGALSGVTLLILGLVAWL
jgi:uncharacterized membrane protein (DUF4010 family)